MKKTLLIVTAVYIIGLLTIPSAIAEMRDDNYQALLEELQQKIDEADKRMVAHPKFLEELRALVEKYRAKIRTTFFSDDFSDGDFTNNPAWAVVSGQFSIDMDHRLRSDIYAKPPTTTTARPRGPATAITPIPPWVWHFIRTAHLCAAS